MSQDAAGPLLRLDRVSVQLDGGLPVLRSISLSLARGGTLGLIGESGCGKSMLALSLMGLLPERAQVQGAMWLGQTPLHSLSEAQWCAVRGSRMAMVFQEPMSALNPLHTIGQQVAEGLHLHRGLRGAAARAESLRLLERVQMPQAQQRLSAYPHQLSGGQRQRVVLAMALACGPELLVADEPTTALDATVQQEVLNLIAELVTELGMGLILISHDLRMIARRVAQVAVMYAGELVEQGPAERLMQAPSHPYTRALMAARPRLGLARGTRLPVLPGRVPPLDARMLGCRFAPRCAQAQPDCRAAPVDLQTRHDGQVRCLFPITEALP